jgi:hypothetical protein
MTVSKGVFIATSLLRAAPAAIGRNEWSLVNACALTFVKATPVQCMLTFRDDLVHLPVPEDRAKSSGSRYR